jgi:hypothetical protein
MKFVDQFDPIELPQMKCLYANQHSNVASNEMEIVDN